MRTIQETILRNLMNPTMLDLDNFLCAEDHRSGALVGFGQVGLGTLFFSFCVALQKLRATAIMSPNCTRLVRHRERHRHFSVGQIRDCLTLLSLVLSPVLTMNATQL